MLMEAETLKKTDVLNYLIVMDLVKTEDTQAMYGSLSINSRKKIMAAMLHDDLLGSGTRVMVEGRELYSKIYTFDSHKDCRFDNSFGTAIDSVDFSIVSGKDIWSYIYGEYFVNNRLSSEMPGFGLIRV